jgi:translation initiation factor 2B subunit (eIF-2B alpha/beta/delta family)
MRQMLDDSLTERVAQIAADRQSGASEITAQVLQLLVTALERADPIQPLGRALVHAQPSMAPIWNAVRAALGAADPEGLRLYAQRVARAPSALTRHAIALLSRDEAADRELKLITLSFSGTVLMTLRHAAQQCRLAVSCAEGHPALEGRRMAEQLAVAGIPVTHYSDAAIAHALTGADAVVVGADAISPAWFLNKSGTRMLAAAAAQSGVPVYVLATRNKFLSSAVAPRLTVRDESPAEVWPAAPPGITVRNPYFEPTSLDLVSAVISDAGVLGAALVPDACPTAGDDWLINLLD